MRRFGSALAMGWLENDRDGAGLHSSPCSSIGYQDSWGADSQLKCGGADTADAVGYA